ncbi:hypothetical protein [Anaplasma phagocytophilum]|nr:hypothetical protein [Anaplasma phagocytophilum]
MSYALRFILCVMDRQNIVYGLYSADEERSSVQCNGRKYGEASE